MAAVVSPARRLVTIPFCTESEDCSARRAQTGSDSAQYEEQLQLFIARDNWVITIKLQQLQEENSYNSSDGSHQHISFSWICISYENVRALLYGLPRTQGSKTPAFQLRKVYNAEQTPTGTHSYLCNVTETEVSCNPDLNSHNTVTTPPVTEPHAALCDSNGGRLNTSWLTGKSAPTWALN